MFVRNLEKNKIKIKKKIHDILKLKDVFIK